VEKLNPFGAILSRLVTSPTIGELSFLQETIEARSNKAKIERFILYNLSGYTELILKSLPFVNYMLETYQQFGL